MQKTLFVILALLLGTSNGYASEELAAAIENVRHNCGNISHKLGEMKKMAGINTAVTAAGTATGVAAVAVSNVKETVDSDIATAETISSYYDSEDRASVAKQLKDQGLDLADAITIDGKDNEYVKKSKTLGDVRTGMLATSTAANIAGAAIAGKNLDNGDLESVIDACKASITALRGVMLQARLDGEDISAANRIESACRQYEYAPDIKMITLTGKGAIVTSAIGAATGLSGTVTSAVSNTNNVRGDNTDVGRAKEKKLNTASNILSGTTMLVSGASVALNASQIKAIKRLSNVADECEDALNQALNQSENQTETQAVSIEVFSDEAMQ